MGELLSEFFLFYSAPIVFYIALVIFSPLQWSWFWFSVAVILSTIASLIRERRLSKSMTEAYFLGMRYLKNRYNLPSFFGNNWDEREDEESEEDRATFEHFSAKMTGEQFQRIFPEEHKKQEEKMNQFKNVRFSFTEEQIEQDEKKSKKGINMFNR